MPPTFAAYMCIWITKAYITPFYCMYLNSQSNSSYVCIDSSKACNTVPFSFAITSDTPTNALVCCD